MPISVRSFSTLTFVNYPTIQCQILKSVRRPQKSRLQAWVLAVQLQSLLHECKLRYDIRYALVPMTQNYNWKSTVTSIQPLVRYEKIRCAANVWIEAFNVSQFFTHYALITSQLHQTCRQYDYCSHVSRSLCKHNNSLLIRMKEGYCIENCVPHLTAASRKENKCSDITFIYIYIYIYIYVCACVCIHTHTHTQ
jgi:hypothetical protein